MKNALRNLIVAAAIIALPAFGQSPEYVTKTASGSTTSVVFFATSPQLQARIVGAIASSDLSGSYIQIKGGTTPVSCAYTNPAANKWFGVSATNGFAIGDFVLVETRSGLITNAQIAAFTAATNIIFTDKIMATVPGDQLYKLGPGTTLWCGVFTNRNYQGEALFVGQRGRPVQVLVNGTSACALDSVTARYE